MAINVMQPPVLAGQTFEQAASQLYSYLFQLSERLNVVLNDLSEDQFTESVKRAMNAAGGAATEREIRDSYSQLRSLIVTTANSIEAEMDTLERSLDGRFVAQSDFGTYTEETNNKIIENANNITQYYTLTQTLVSNIADIDSYVQQTEAYIKTGLLDNTGPDPVYGVEIGQRNSSDEAPDMVRITASRIGFYQHGNEACYISNGRWGAPGIDVGENIVFNNLWDQGTDSTGAFYLRYIGGLA